MLRTAESAPDRFVISEARALIKDLFHPKPAIYWTDLLLTVAVAYASFGLVRGLNQLLPSAGALRLALQALAFVVSGLAIYRAGVFMHELVHLPRRGFRGFSIAWNLLCGIPFLTPLFVYETHRDHHRRKHYGTGQDGEYLPLEHGGPRLILLYLLEQLVVPILVVLRFAVIAPVSWCVPPLRRWVLQYASSAVIYPFYKRPMPGKRERFVFFWQELGCFLWCMGIVVGARVLFDRWPWPMLLQGYCTALFVLGVNAVRTLGAHRYRNAGDEMTFVDQLLDSVNYHHRPWLAELWGPVGTRYHALHHLFPSLPYHAMPEAHRRLTAGLPANSPYHQTEAVSLLATVGDLWRRAASRTRTVAVRTARS